MEEVARRLVTVHVALAGRLDGVTNDALAALPLEHRSALGVAVRYGAAPERLAAVLGE